MTSTNFDDQVVWQAFKKGDEEAFAALYQRYAKTLYSYGKRLAGDDTCIEDHIQDLFIELWQSRTRLADVTSPQYYLFRSLRRKIFRSIQHPSSHGQSLEFTDEGVLPIALPKEIEMIEAESWEKQKSEIEHWLHSLPVRQQEVIMLRYYQDFSYAEISELLSIHEQSVRNLVQRAVLKLRQLTHPTLLLSLFYFF